MDAFLSLIPFALKLFSRLLKILYCRSTFHYFNGFLFFSCKVMGYFSEKL